MSHNTFTPAILSHRIPQLEVRVRMQFLLQKQKTSHYYNIHQKKTRVQSRFGLWYKMVVL